MVTFIGDIHFWTLRDDVIVKDADLGAFRYQDKNSVCKERVYYEDKKQYTESRGVLITPKNSRPGKLRDSLREFEDLLNNSRVVWEGWQDSQVYRLIISSGIIVSLTINPLTGDITRIAFDKFLLGKLLSEHVADVVVTAQHMVFSYNEYRLSVVHLTKAPPEGLTTERLSSLDPKIQTCEVAGPTGRRFERKLSANITGDMIVVWWQSSDSEVYPWSPLAKDRERANILVYGLQGTFLQLLCYCRTEMPPLSVTFSKVQPNVLLTVEQGFGKKGGVTVLSCVYEVEQGTLHRMSVTSVPLEAPLMAHSHNPTEDRLLLACNNGVLALHCDSRGMTHVTKAGLIPANIAWLDSGNIVAISNDRGQIQCFDLALSLVRMQLVREEPNPQRILDFSDNFIHQQSLSFLQWAPTNKYHSGHNQLHSPHLLLLHYTRGPLACLCIHLNTSNGGITATRLVNQYLKHGQVDEAVNLLVSLSWESEGNMAVQCLSAICNYLLMSPLTQTAENQLEGALASFHTPVQPLIAAVEEEFGPSVRALTRRFFFLVLRCGHLDKALRLAIDIGDSDCFMAVNKAALRVGDSQVAASAMQHHDHLQSSCSSSHSCSSVLYGSGGSSYSESCSKSCSTCFSDSASDSVSEEEESNQEGVDEITNGNRNDNSEIPAANLPLNQSVSYVSSNIPNSPSRGSVSHATAITQQDGTVTINIRQPDRLNSSNNSEQPPHHHSSGHSKRKQSKRIEQPSRASESRSTRTVREVFYSSDPNEEFVDAETVFVDKESLQNQYDRSVFHEVSTEEEEGGTVKVVHFGVV